MDREDTRATALLVMDLQRNIVRRIGEGAFLDRDAVALEAARAAVVRVIYVRVMFRSAYPEISSRNRSFSSLREAGGFLEGDSDAEIHPAVSPRPGDPLVTKRRVGAFSGSDLDVLLRAGGITTLVLSGVSTSGVVLSTVRAAADQDYRLIVLRDACIDGDAEVHGILMEKVFPRQAEVLNVDEWTQRLHGPPASS